VAAERAGKLHGSPPIPPEILKRCPRGCYPVKKNCLRSLEILKGIDEIRHYINPESPVSRFKVKELIRIGMPADISGWLWYAHAENVDEWFKKITRKDYSKVPDDVLDSAE
jgi:hypothetical protein